jgi:transcription termination factor NusB
MKQQYSQPHQDIDQEKFLKIKQAIVNNPDILQNQNNIHPSFRNYIQAMYKKIDDESAKTDDSISGMISKYANWGRLDSLIKAGAIIGIDK